MHRERILLVNESRELAASVLETLEEGGFDADYASDGAQGLRLALATTPPFECLILDVELPRLSGLEVCGRLRQEGFKAPILMLTSQGAAEQVVDGLERGADDYIVKPFDAKVLIARVRAAIRRYLSVPDRAGIVQAAALVLDTARSRLLLASGGKLPLTPLQTRLLHTLMRHAPRVVTREELESALWGEKQRPTSNALRAHLYQLRRIIAGAGATARIQTCGKQGYCLEAIPNRSS